MRIIFGVLFFLTSLSFAQKINQYDENGKRHGIWQKNYEGTDEPRYIGQFEHGKEVGLFKYYKLVRTKSMLAATKAFNPENNLAITKFFSSRGKLISEGVMDGKRYIDKWIFYHKDGKTIMTIEHYNNVGILHGTKQVFYNKTQIDEDVNYNNGELDGEAKYYAENGKLIKSYIYKNGKLNGYSKHFDIQGNLLVEGNYRNDKKHGIWKYYENGKLINTKDFTVYSKNPYKINKKN